MFACLWKFILFRTLSLSNLILTSETLFSSATAIFIVLFSWPLVEINENFTCDIFLTSGKRFCVCNKECVFFSVHFLIKSSLDLYNVLWFSEKTNFWFWEVGDQIFYSSCWLPFSWLLSSLIITHVPWLVDFLSSSIFITNFPLSPFNILFDDCACSISISATSEIPLLFSKSYFLELESPN